MSSRAALVGGVAELAAVIFLTIAICGAWPMKLRALSVTAFAVAAAAFVIALIIRRPGEPEKREEQQVFADASRAVDAEPVYTAEGPTAL